MDRDKSSNLYRGPPIDDTYQVSVDLAKRFQRRRFFSFHPNPLTNMPPQTILVSDWLISKKSSPLKPLSRRRMPSDGKSSPCLAR
jgi:hypothetical protein